MTLQATRRHLFSSTTLGWVGIVAGVLAACAFGLRQVDGSTSYIVPAAVEVADQEECVVRPLDPSLDRVTVTCGEGTPPGAILNVEYGGVTDVPIGTGVNLAAQFVFVVSGLVAVTALGRLWNRGSDVETAETLADQWSEIPRAAISVAGESLDDAVVRDRWRAPPVPPAGVSTKIRTPFAATVSITLGVLGLPGVFLIAGGSADRLGLPAPWPLLVSAALTAGGLFLVGRGAARGVRWTPEGLRIRTVTGTTKIPWSEIHHVTASASSQSTKGGRYWTGLPELVTMNGDRVKVAPLQRTEGVYRPRFVAARAADDVTTFDTWLDGADVPVDAAYDTYRAWMLGMLPVAEVVRMSAVASTDLHPVLARELHALEEAPPTARPAPPGPSGVAPVDGAPSSPPMPTERRRGRAVRVVGWVLLVPVALLFLVSVPFAAVDMAVGSPVEVVVAEITPDDCVVTDTNDPASEWQANCESEWSVGDSATVTIGGLSDKPTSWGRVMTAAIGLLILAVPGATLLGIGYSLR